MSGIHCDSPVQDRTNGAKRSSWKSIASALYYHAKTHTGVGIICSVAYFDPGNWGVDLQAGSKFGYKLLFVVLLAGLFAVFLQVLAGRLGCVTGLDLAAHCRLLLHDRPKHTLLCRWLVLYPLYACCEIAIISTDLAELLGSAIALCMIFPSLPLWAGLLITAFDVLFLLALGNPLRGRPVKMFEFLISGLVLSVLVCMIVIISKLHINWVNAFDGFVPSKYIFMRDGLYISVGILGATVMPHSLILGSALATQDRISEPPPDASDASQEQKELTANVERVSRLRLLFDTFSNSFVSMFRIPPVDPSITHPKTHVERENNPLAFVKAHLFHGIVDVVASLLGFAVIINSLILILASSVFFKGYNDGDSDAPASLFDAHNLIQKRVGNAPAFLFALALLAAGQSSSIIATVAGQAVSEGFLRWKVSPALRRLATRSIGLIPSMVVAIAVGEDGISQLLVLSQVILSLVLPFITFPLIYLTTSKNIMRVRKPQAPLGNSVSCAKPTESDRTEAIDMEQAADTVDFSNGIIVAGIGYAIWLIMIAANIYVLCRFGDIHV